jgi:hypothetical protein
MIVDTGKVRAATASLERARAGELLAQMAERGERAVRKNMKSQAATSKLSDLGVTKKQPPCMYCGRREDCDCYGYLV